MLGETFKQQSWGRALPSPSVDSQRSRAWPTTHREGLFLISDRGSLLFPSMEKHPDLQRSQSRLGVALCCPLAYIPCPALSRATSPPDCLPSGAGLTAATTGHRRSGEYLQNPAGGSEGRKGKPSLRSGHICPAHATWGGERRVYCWPRDSHPVGPCPLFSLAQGLVTGGTHKHSLPLGFRG